MQGSVKCWIKDFKAWLESNSETFPITGESAFTNKVINWMLTTEEGKKASAVVGVVSDKIVFTEI